MSTYDFFSAILPPPNFGFYCAAELTSKYKEHRFVASIDEIIDAGAEFDDTGKDAYFGLATYATGANRTAANSKYLRCFFADIDVGAGKPYANIRAALSALQKWCGVTSFPTPYLVLSGGGVHCYWPFVEPVAVDEWRGYADRFKAACKKFSLAIDYSVSADSARVLRIPSTHNYKQDTPRKVKLRIEGEALPFSVYTRILDQYEPEKTAHVKAHSVLDDAPRFAVGSPSFALDLAGISQSSWDPIKAGCGQIAQYIENPTADGLEPLFRAVISIAKYCVDGETIAQELGALHPYAPDRTDKKFHEIKGPYSCEAFSKINSGVCENCAFLGKIVNPLMLGKELKPTGPLILEVAAPPPEDPADPPAPPTEHVFPEPPHGYVLSIRGVGIHFKDAENIPRIAFVADTPFYASHTYDRGGERFVQFVYVEHGVVKSTVMPLQVVTAKDDAVKSFAKIGVVVPVGQDAGFRSYIKATIAEAKKTPPLLMPTSLGWQADDSFAFDNRLFTAHGEQDVPMYGFDNINETIGVRGTIDAWRTVMASVMRMERWDIIAMMMLGFASPLMKFTGLNGITFHLCGNDSGRGKTLCQRLASSVWGVPDKFRVTPNTSPIAMVNRLGMLGNLPLMVDEITHKGRNEAEWFPEFLSQMSDGRGKDRMESQHNAERRNTTTWSSIALMTSNKHMLDYLTAERNHGSEGEIRRLLEVTFDKEFKIDELTRTLLFDTLPQNYGVAGEMYARWLVRNPDTAREVTKSTYAEVFRHFTATGDERFWIAGCASVLAAIRLIGPEHAKILTVNTGKVAAVLLGIVQTMRSETKRMKRTAVDVLNEFTKRNFGKLVTVNGALARIAGIEVAETLDRRDLCGRVEKSQAAGWISYYIEERELKGFCSSLSYGYNEFKRDIEAECPVEYTRKDLLSGTKGPTMLVRVIHIKQRIDVALDLFDEKKKFQDA